MKIKSLLILAIISIITFNLTGCWEVKRGEKTGILVKVSTQGIFMKTTEAELIRGGMNDGSGSFGKAFDFTIENSELHAIAIDAMEKQKQVKIQYHQEALTWFRSESDDYFLDDIQIIN